DLLLERRAQHPFGAADVGVAHRRSLRGRDPDLVDRGGVDHRVAAAHPLADRAFVAKVALDDLAAERFGLLCLLRVAGEDGDLVATGAQLAHHGAADEARSPRNEDLHGTQGYPARPPRTISLSATFAKRPQGSVPERRRG